MAIQRGCSPDTVDGAIAAMNGVETDTMPFAEVEDMDGRPHATGAMVDRINLDKVDVFDAEAAKTHWMQKAADIIGDPVGHLKGFIVDNRNWSGLLGEDFIAPMQDFLEGHFSSYGDDLKAGRGDYNAQLEDILDSLPTDGFSDAQLRLAEKYKALMRDGGPFYGKEGGVGFINNIVGNVIQSSPTVLFGNPLELAYKLPALYPKQMVPAIGKAMELGLFKRIPELEARGVYGSSVGTKNVLGDRKSFEGLIGLTDVPAKNITYWAGELAQQGGGPKAVQDVMFVPRFADIPAVYYSGSGRLTVGLLSYTVNTYKLIAGLSSKALKGDMGALGSLATMYTLAGAIGGVGSESGDPVSSVLASGMPQPLEVAIKKAFPETESWFAENTGSLAKLVKPGSLDRVGIPAQIASRQFTQGVVGSAKESLELAGEGDMTGASIELADALLSLLPFGTGTVFNDQQVQKVKKMAVDVLKCDMDLMDVPAELQDKFLPFTKAE